MSFEDRLRVGLIGERIVDEFLRQKGWIPYRPEPGHAHPFDRLAASPDKRRLCIVEVKTKCRREAFEDTGINRRCFDDYEHATTTYSVPLFLVFVDARLGWVYGNWWAELLKPRPADLVARVGGCTGYPWEQRGIVYFPISAMRWLAQLTDDERSQLLALRITRWTEGDRA